MMITQTRKTQWQYAKYTQQTVKAVKITEV